METEFLRAHRRGGGHVLDEPFGKLLRVAAEGEHLAAGVAGIEITVERGTFGVDVADGGVGIQQKRGIDTAKVIGPGQNLASRFTFEMGKWGEHAPVVDDHPVATLREMGAVARVLALGQVLADQRSRQVWVGSLARAPGQISRSEVPGDLVLDPDPVPLGRQLLLQRLDAALLGFPRLADDEHFPHSPHKPGILHFRWERLPTMELSIG